MACMTIQAPIMARATLKPKIAAVKAIRSIVSYYTQLTLLNLGGEGYQPADQCNDQQKQQAVERLFHFDMKRGLSIQLIT